MIVNRVCEGDCLDVMRNFPDNCIDTVITDPPYALTNRTPDVMRCVACRRVLGGADGKPINCPRCGGALSHQRTEQKRGFMGKQWDNGEVAFGIEVWQEVLRVAKPGATLMAFGGTRTYHRLTCAIEDAGWEIRDCIMWIYGSGFPKSLDIGKAIDKQAGVEREVVGSYDNKDGVVYGMNKTRVAQGARPTITRSNGYITAPATPEAQQWDGWGTALKPSFEPIVVAMKPVDSNFANNALKWGVAGYWIDGGRVETDDNLSGGTYGGVFSGTRDKNGNLCKAIGSGTKGRFPANIIHDGSGEVEAEFAKAGVSVSSDRPRKRQIMTSKGVKGGSYGNPLKIEHNGYNGYTGGFTGTGTPSRFFYTAKASSSERGDYNNHPTVKPLELLKYLARLTKTPTGGVILDPFAGSGTTALAAIAEGRDYIMIEKEPEYCEIINRRIAEYTGQEIAVKEVEITEDKKAKQLSLW